MVRIFSYDFDTIFFLLVDMGDKTQNEDLSSCYKKLINDEELKNLPVKGIIVLEQKKYEDKSSRAMNFPVPSQITFPVLFIRGCSTYPSIIRIIDLTKNLG